MALEKVRSVEAGSEAKVDVKLLSRRDLQDFLKRRNAAEHSRLVTTMVVEGYEAYVEQLRQRYGVVGKLSVDAQTGQIIVTNPEPTADVPDPAEEPTGG